MLLYHGTTLEKFEKIVESGKILPHAKLDSQYHTWGEDFYRTELRRNGIFLTSSKSLAMSMARNKQKPFTVMVLLEIHIGKRKIRKSEYDFDKIHYAPNGMSVKAIRGATVLSYNDSYKLGD